MSSIAFPAVDFPRVRLRLWLPVFRLLLLTASPVLLLHWGVWSETMSARVLPASFPALLHLALAFPGRPPLASRHPYLLGWVYCVPLLTTTAWLTARIMAPFLGNHTACNLGILLVERFHSAPPAVQFTLGMLSLLAVAGLARWTGWAIREKGWRQGVWQRPIQTTAMLVAVPPCGALSLAAGCCFWELPAALRDFTAWGFDTLLYSEMYTAIALLWVVFPAGILLALLQATVPSWTTTLRRRLATARLMLL
jgi:hypothetical protein